MSLRLAALLAVVGWVPPEKPVRFPKLEVPGVPNVIQVNAKVLSGGLPEGDQAFANLAAMNVKTIISVDGVTPDVETARKYGMRYIHLPHGYDGVPNMRAMELAKAVSGLQGKIFIHCHHGKHRSPTAAAVACVGAGLLAKEKAEDVLKAGGTDPHYLGLYESARKAKRFEPDELDALQTQFKEVVALPPIAKSMVDIDELNDRIARAEKNDWKPAKASDKPIRHDVLLLREHFHELQRNPEVKKKPPEFVKSLQNGEMRLVELEEALSEKAPATAKVETLWKDVQRNCTTCHGKFRDVPLREETD